MNSLKSVLTLLAFVALAGGAYVANQRYNFLDTAKQYTKLEEEVVELERDAIVYLEKIKDTELDSSIFSRKDYASLKDIGVALPKPVVSRQDPFAEL